MSHGIKELDKGFVKGKTWHNLDAYKQLERAVTLDEALSVFDYEDHIELLPNMVTINGGNYLTNTYSIVRKDHNKVLNGGVKGRYTLCDMRDITKLAYSQICEPFSDDHLDVQIESVGTLENGSIQFVSMVFDNFKVHGDDSDTLNRVMVTNDYRGGGVKTLISQVRVVCKNTRGFAISQAKNQGRIATTKHTRNVNDNVKRVMINMSDVVVQMQEEKNKLDALSKAPQMSWDKIDIVLNNLFPIKNEKGSRNKNKQDEIKTVFSEGQDGLEGRYSLTPYAFFNSITNVLGQEVGRNGTSGDWDNVMGKRASIKEQALDQILEVSNIGY
tara:strand:+ start:4560 stop:5546 length:987 start_codon:yes stop_codon:yes gene_type:complete